MVRLSETLLPKRPKKTSVEKKERAEESLQKDLPEITILTGSSDVVDLVRNAVEEKGYRVHHTLTPDELLARLKVVGRVLLVVDGNIDGIKRLLDNPALASHTYLVLAEQDQREGDLFSGISKSQVLTYPVVPEDLLAVIHNIVTGKKTTGDNKGSGLFSSLPNQPTGVRPPGVVPAPPTDESTDETSTDTEAPESPEEDSTRLPMVAPPRPKGGGAKLSELISTVPATPAEAEKQTGPAGVKDSYDYEAETPQTTSPIEEFEKAKSDAYSVAVEAVRVFMSGHRTATDPGIGDVAESVEGMINELEVSNNLALEVIHHTPSFDNVDEYLSHHLVNTASIAITIGKGLKLSPRNLFELALSTIIHDVGETQLPAGMIVRHGKLDESGYALMKQHPSYGRDLLKPYARAYSWLPIVVYQEHERYDGSGYPEGLSGDDIHLYARIIGLADTYEALTHSRPFRDQIIPFNVLQQLIRLGGRLFHSDLVKTLIDQISVFPLGSQVLLNTGETGKVIQTNKGYPLRPIVQIQFASDGTPINKGRQLNLKAEPMLYITGPVENKG